MHSQPFVHHSDRYEGEAQDTRPSVHVAGRLFRLFEFDQHNQGWISASVRSVSRVMWRIVSSRLARGAGPFNRVREFSQAEWLGHKTIGFQELLV